jgi:hypothetical protein
MQPDTRLVMFAADKAASDLANEVLGNEKEGVLERLQAVYLADISGMPALVTRCSPCPRCAPCPSDRPRPGSRRAGRPPRQKGGVSVIRLADGKVRAWTTPRTPPAQALLGLN